MAPLLRSSQLEQIKVSAMAIMWRRLQIRTMLLSIVVIMVLVGSYTYLGKAGLKFYTSEEDFTGLGALCPNDPNTLYISTPFDPRDTSKSLGMREIWKGVTANNGIRLELDTDNAEFRP